MGFLHDGTGKNLCCLALVELAWLFLEPEASCLLASNRSLKVCYDRSLANKQLASDTGLDHCPRILLSCFRARTSAGRPLRPSVGGFLGAGACMHMADCIIHEREGEWRIGTDHAPTGELAFCCPKRHLPLILNFS